MAAKIIICHLLPNDKKMKTKHLLTITLLIFINTLYSKDTKSNGYPISPVSFTNVTITDAFWGQRLKASREVTIPLAFRKCEETGRYTNFCNAAHPTDSCEVKGFSFDDTDVYKTIEGASYLMQTYKDEQLDKYIDSVLLIVAAAQEKDGYLYTARTMNPEHPHDWAGDKRWEKVEDLSHELYNLGHMIEGAVAHYQSTGKTSFLTIAKDYADCAIRAIGEKEDQIVVVPGHQIAEMALAKLYVLTGEQRYLDFAKFLLDKRGYTTIKQEYSQSHLPVVEQNEAVGHAVRAAYMYTGMADVAALTGDSTYIKAVDAIWSNIVDKKLYITGGIGSTRHGEAFGENYDLPNMTAYCETCAAIGNVYMNYRLFLLHGDAKYFDVLERTLYNGLISGVSLEGDAFFYPNPLQSIGQHQRSAWFGCACCPSNVSRFIPSVPGYVYAQDKEDIYVNLFMSNTMNVTVNNTNIELKQTTNYPWEGNISIAVSPEKECDFNLKVRIPGWVKNEVTPGELYTYTDDKQPNYSISLNGEQVEGRLENGYFTLVNKWKKGDHVEIHFDMMPRTVKAQHAVKADQGRVAIERGPIVYCAEWVDNDYTVANAVMCQNPEFKIQHKDDLLYGVTTLQTEAQLFKYNKKGRIVVDNVTLNMIPYYAWAHRGAGDMIVWLSNELSSSKPVQAPTIASESKISASHSTKAISAINDRLTPEDNIAVPYYHWWPKNGSTEWIIYDFEKEAQVKACSIFWYDDAPWGGCRIPKSWKIYYQSETKDWIPVNNTTEYTTKKDDINTIKFNAITTKALKLEVVLPSDNSAGVIEWQVH